MTSSLPMDLRDAPVSIGWLEKEEDGGLVLVSPNGILGLDPGLLSEDYLMSVLPALRRRVENQEGAVLHGDFVPYSSEAMADVYQLIEFIEGRFGQTA